MQSIRGKFLRLNLVSILLCVILIGGVGLWSLSVIQANTSRDILSLTCRAEGQALDDSIRSIKDSVDLFCAMTDNRVPSLAILRDQTFVDDLFAVAEMDFGQIARVTHGVCAYYFRTAPELTPKPEGFFYGKEPGSDQIVRQPLTDLSVYDPSDTEHVGWYYQPQVAGKPIWMEPYYNKNLDIYMVSYVVPFFRNGVFWGIAGMDIDFDVVIERVRAINPYDTGYAFLCNDHGIVHWHPEVAIGSNVTDYIDELDSLQEALSALDGQPTFRYHYNGVGKTISCYSLQNGMKLMLAVPNSEIKAPMVAMFRVVVLAAILFCAVVAVMIVKISNRITHPLESLTQAARKIADGNLDVDLPDPSGDEVGILTRSFEVTVSSLKRYVASMNNMAFTDPLTQVKNKTAYDRATLGLQKDMDEGNAEYALVMFDLNNLKSINDAYGHERGDEYLVCCCSLICGVFKRSPVFRIGGDEFVAILVGESYASRDALMAELNRAIEDSLSAEEPWRRLSIAKGLAVYDKSDATPDAVFVRADEAMYQDKRRMKGLGQ